ncbi:invasion associated locus B family protein [Amorphus orientalis]|uniref:Invasion protein IalB n=1 Tax=Amorphus orientalis TaxID=649198 RepID=A0AAE3VK68_9HYPH|nr:invasion associated locus B family protein [Amorphus orientalis]MDQ0313869.1 invasion protein IalB [Amorphus orientalis]
MLKRIAILAACVSFLATGAAMAQSSKPTLLQQYSDWEVYTYDGQNGKICYALSKPKDMQPANRDHGDVFLFVSNRPSEGVKGETSVLVGYTFQENSSVSVDVDGQKFTMFTKGDGAWMENPAQEASLLEAMRAGRAMSISGTSSRGTDTVYRFSLSGVTAATNRLNQVCS